MITRRTRFNELPEYLSVAELASYLGLSRTLAYDYARQYGVRFGRLLRVPKATLPAASRTAERSVEPDDRPGNQLPQQNMIHLFVTVAVPMLLRGFAKACADAARVLEGHRADS